MDKIAGRIEGFLRERSLSQKDFADALGFTPGYINDILRGRTTPSIRVVERMTQVFNISADWLMSGKGRKYGERRGRDWDEKVEVVTPEELSKGGGKFGRRRNDFIALPVLDDTNVSQLHKKATDITAFPAEHYHVVPFNRVRRPRTTFCHRVGNRDMEPTMPAGSIVAVDSSVRTPTRLQGRLCTIKGRSAPVIRRLRVTKSHLVFEADAPTRHARPIHVKNCNINPIIGRVEWFDNPNTC